MQFAKKKRKREDSGSDVDLDVTPPPSPKEGDANMEKRRSGRVTATKKKYVDDVDLNFSDDEIMPNAPPEVVAEGDNATTGSGTATPKNGKGEEVAATPGDMTPMNETSLDASQSGPNYAYVVSFF